MIMAASFALALVAASTAAPKGPDGLRLLQFGENETRWMSLEEIDNMT